MKTGMWPNCLILRIIKYFFKKRTLTIVHLASSQDLCMILPFVYRYHLFLEQAELSCLF